MSFQMDNVKTQMKKKSFVKNIQDRKFVIPDVTPVTEDIGPKYQTKTNKYMRVSCLQSPYLLSVS